MPTRPPRRPTLIAVRAVWTIGFGVGTATHLSDLAFEGPEVYSGFPEAVRLFWVALTVLDPLTIALVWLRPRAAAVLGVAIMVADVAVNGTVLATYGGLGVSGVLLQGMFLLLVLATAPVLWRARV